MPVINFGAKKEHQFAQNLNLDDEARVRSTATKVIVNKSCVYVGPGLEHTIRKCKKMAGQNTFKFLLLNDANIIEEH